jgi:type VI secretion system protein ImpC
VAEKHWRSDVRLVADVEHTSTASDDPAANPGGPLLVVVLGDFAGSSCVPRSAADEPPPVAERPLVEVDRDNLEAVLARLGPTWELPPDDGAGAASSGLRLRFAALDDFHPDRLVARLEPLARLVAMRRAVDDPVRVEAVAAEVLGPDRPKPAGRPGPAAAPRDVTAGQLLDDILSGSTAPVRLEPSGPAGDFQRTVEDIVAPHLVRVDASRQDEVRTALDRTLAERVRGVLHDPGFQRLEALWRGLDWLVRRADTDAGPKIRILQATKEDLGADLGAGAPPDATGLGRLLLQPASVPGGPRPVLLLGTYDFADDEADLSLLAGLGEIARRLGASFVAAASPRLLRCDAYTEIPEPGAADAVAGLGGRGYDAWNALRRSPQAGSLALALPRFLCRLPYGADTDPIEAFAFEERPAHDGLLWANPAFAVAAVVLEAVCAGGWSAIASGAVHRLEGLPYYVRRDEAAGAAAPVPCAEVLLHDGLVEILERNGLVPLVSHAAADVVALPSLRSLAEPRSPLHFVAGRR